ncbi:MAG: hypothetical protein WC812_00895 [Candidatus Pacearchaeota archaeon]|jgi:hypothetical protein
MDRDIICKLQNILLLYEKVKGLNEKKLKDSPEYRNYLMLTNEISQYEFKGEEVIEILQSKIIHETYASQIDYLSKEWKECETKLENLIKGIQEFLHEESKLNQPEKILDIITQAISKSILEQRKKTTEKLEEILDENK